MWLKISARHLISPLIQRGSKSHKDPYAGFLSLCLRRIRADRRQDWSRWDARFLQVIFTPVPPVLLSDIPDIRTGDYLMRLCLKIDRRTGGTRESISLFNLRQVNPSTGRELAASANGAEDRCLRAVSGCNTGKCENETKLKSDS